MSELQMGYADGPMYPTVEPVLVAIEKRSLSPLSTGFSRNKTRLSMGVYWTFVGQALTGRRQAIEKIGAPAATKAELQSTHKAWRHRFFAKGDRGHCGIRMTEKPKISEHEAQALIKGMGRECAIVVHDDGTVRAVANLTGEVLYCDRSDTSGELASPRKSISGRQTAFGRSFCLRFQN